MLPPYSHETAELRTAVARLAGTPEGQSILHMLLQEVRTIGQYLLWSRVLALFDKADPVSRAMARENKTITVQRQAHKNVYFTIVCVTIEVQREKVNAIE